VVHSFKFAAELQEKQAGNNPALIRIETKTGHGAGKPIAMITMNMQTSLGTLFNIGIEVIPEKLKDKVKG
jgi:prolyl oligopeptidase